MKKYKCKICGYVYDPAKGDTSSGVEKNTPFENLPAQWVCPICKANKSKFISESK